LTIFVLETGSRARTKLAVQQEQQDSFSSYQADDEVARLFVQYQPLSLHVQFGSTKQTEAD
jgi:hypothetical protein